MKVALFGSLIVGIVMIVAALFHLNLPWFPLGDQSLRGFAFASLVLVCGMILTLFVLCLGASLAREALASLAAKDSEALRKVITLGLSKKTAKMLMENNSGSEAEKPQTN